MSNRLCAWKEKLVSVGLFIVFVVEFTEFVIQKIWHIVHPLLK